jgi:hypothetical protein
MLAADLIFCLALLVVVAANLYHAPRIPGDRVAMQWGFDGKPTWSAPKTLALWGMVAFMLVVRLFIWAAMTYVPNKVNGPELALALFSLIVAASHLFVLRSAAKAR